MFLGFVGSPRDFLGFDFCPHLNPEYLSSFSAAFVPRGENMGEFDEKYWQQELRVVIYVVM